MRIIQSYWSKPSFHSEQGYENTRNLGGWMHIKYLWLSTAYSCYCAKRHHKKVELLTDGYGYAMLIDRLQLPYNDATATIDSIANEDHRLWVLGKLLAFQNQTTPFIHIDNDVYLWQTLPSKESNFLITQSRIRIPENYKATLRQVFEHFNYLPECIEKRGIPQNFLVINAGIIGGNNLDFFQEYCSLARAFVEKNKTCLAKINVGLFNTILDEYLFTCLAEEKNQKVSFLFDVPVEDSFTATVRFNLVPFMDKYVHLIGSAKRNQYACEQLEYRFRFEFPQEYKRVSNVLFDMCPPDSKLNIHDDPEKWQQVKKSFDILYASNVDDLLFRKIQLPEQVQIKEQINEQGEAECRITISGRNNGKSKSWKLEEMDEALIHFGSPVCINELLEGLRGEGFIQDEESLAQYRFKLIDFVTEKITIDGVLEFS